MQSEKKQFYRYYFGMAFPLIAQNILTAVIGASDAIMLGTLEQNALSAVTLAAQVSQIFSYFIMALCTGSTALAAQYYGNNDLDSVKKVMNITMQISIAGGIIFFAIALFFPRAIMSFYTNEQLLIEKGIPYLRIVSLSFLFMSFSQIYMNIMQNTGRVKTSSLFGSITVILNIVLNSLLIFGLLGLPALGVAGAAIATSASRGVEFILVLVVSKLNKEIPFKVTGLFHVYKALMKKFWRYTFPCIIQKLSWIVATSFTVAILSHLGSDVTAANAVAIIVFTIAEGIAFGLAASTGIVIGQKLGKGELTEAKKTGERLVKISVWAGVLAGVVICLMSPLIVKICGNMTAAASANLKFMLCFIGFKCIGKFVNTNLSRGIFTAGGDMSFLLKLDVINMWLVTLPISFIAAYVLKLSPLVVYALVNMDEYYKFFSMIAHYKKYMWVKNLTKKEWAANGTHEDVMRKKIFLEMPLGVMVISSPGKISLVNDACAKILGYSVDDIEGSNYIELFENSGENEAFADAIIEAVGDKMTPHECTVDYSKNGVTKKLSVKTMFMEEEDAKLGVCVMISEK